jgi:hypothetical protein
MSIGIHGNYGYKGISLFGSLDYDGRKIRGNGKIENKKFGSFNADYDSESNSMKLYTKPSLFSRLMSNFGTIGYIGTGVAAGLCAYSSMPADDPYRAIFSIGAGLIVGLLSLFTFSKPKYSFKLF